MNHPTHENPLSFLSCKFHGALLTSEEDYKCAFRAQRSDVHGWLTGLGTLSTKPVNRRMSFQEISSSNNSLGSKTLGR